MERLMGLEPTTFSLGRCWCVAPGIQPRFRGLQGGFRGAELPPGETIRMKSRTHPNHKT